MTHLPESPSGRERWRAAYDAARGRGTDPRRRLHHPVRGRGRSGLRSRRTRGSDPRMERIGWPGEFPYTRGLYPTGYRGREWTIRQFAGFGNAPQTNERYRMILDAGGGGLSVAFDMPTLMGRDSDDPRSLGEVGHCGVAIDSAADMEVLFAGIDLGAVTTSMTISGPAVPIFCMYLVAAERQGVLDRPTQRHSADRHLQGVHRAEGVAVRPRAAPAPDRRPDGVLPGRGAGLQAAQRLRLPHPRGGLDGSAGAGLHLGRRLRLRGAGFVPRARRRRLRARAELLLRCPHRLLRGDRQVPGRPSDLGALAAGPVRSHDGQGPVAALPHPDRRGVADRPAAVQQRGPDRRGGDRRRAGRDELAAHQRTRRDPRAAERVLGGDRAADPAGAGRGDRA